MGQLLESEKSLRMNGVLEPLLFLPTTATITPSCQMDNMEDMVDEEDDDIATISSTRNCQS